MSEIAHIWSLHDRGDSRAGSPARPQQGGCSPSGTSTQSLATVRANLIALAGSGYEIVPDRPIGDGERGLGPARSGAPSSLGWMARPPSTVVRLGSRRVVRRRAAVLLHVSGLVGVEPSGPTPECPSAGVASVQHDG